MSAGITKVIKKLRAANDSRFLILSIYILYHEHRSRKMRLRQNVERKKKTATPGASLLPFGSVLSFTTFRPTQKTDRCPEYI